MRMLWVINQDRDEIVDVYDIKDLYILPARINEKIMGYNLYFTDVLLGTFDTVKESLIELNKILNSKEEFYVVSGYSDYTLKSL